MENSNQFARLLEVRRETPHKLQNLLGFAADAAAVSTDVHPCLIIGRRDSFMSMWAIQ
jgi:hypothetical protein